MKKLLLCALVIAAVAVPAAMAETTPQAPGAYCVTHKDQIGLGKTYLTMRACVRVQKHRHDENVVNAAKDCIAERDDVDFAANHGGRTFDQFYGTNGDNSKGKGKGPGGATGATGASGASGGNGNGFGKCVSQKANTKTAEQQTAQTNAAKKCRLPELKAQIGIGKKYRNFGGCVSAQLKPATG